jgi:soluble cytochrome b562
MEIIDAIMRWIVAPIAAFVWLIHRQTQQHATDIAVLKADKAHHDREFKQLRDDMKAIISKLDNIEQALRK